MLGLVSSNPSPAELQETYRRVASAKVFGESVQPFLDATGKDLKSVMRALEEMENLLGLLEPYPFMSFQKGIVDPRDFRGVAFLLPGITNWGATLRPDQLEHSILSGAKFDKVIAMWSSRKCNAPADKRHPYIRDLADGDEPTEKAVMELVAERRRFKNVVFPDLPWATDEGRPLSLQAQLEYLVKTGQYKELVGDKPVYIPGNPNAFYVPLHVRRVLHLDDIHFSQAGAHSVRKMPDGYWPSLQDILTTPNGIIRLMMELKMAGSITDDAHLLRARRAK